MAKEKQICKYTPRKRGKKVYYGMLLHKHGGKAYKGARYYIEDTPSNGAETGSTQAGA